MSKPTAIVVGAAAERDFESPRATRVGGFSETIESC